MPKDSLKTTTIATGSPMLKDWKEDLKNTGWVQVDGITNDDQLLSLAKCLGVPVPISDASYITVLRPTPSHQAKPHTLSSSHGQGAFPLHTDTAFWPLPTRYLIMRVLGDHSRPTTILDFKTVFNHCSKRELHDIRQSIWRIKVPGLQFYCSMKFNHCHQAGWRFDPHCMSPVNEAARRVATKFSLQVNRCHPFSVNWAIGKAVVIDNWRALHGRGPRPVREGDRLLHRIYVESPR